MCSINFMAVAAPTARVSASSILEEFIASELPIYAYIFFLGVMEGTSFTDMAAKIRDCTSYTISAFPSFSAFSLDFKYFKMDVILARRPPFLFRHLLLPLYFLSELFDIN